MRVLCMFWRVALRWLAVSFLGGGGVHCRTVGLRLNVMSHELLMRSIAIVRCAEVQVCMYGTYGGDLSPLLPKPSVFLTECDMKPRSDSMYSDYRHTHSYNSPTHSGSLVA